MAKHCASFYFRIIVTLTLFCILNGQSPVTNAPNETTNADSEVETTTKKLHVRQEWMTMDKELKAAVSKILRKAMPVLMKEIYKKEISTQCLGALMQFTTALKQSKLWAYQMLDSSGRFPEGFLSLTLTSLGNYEECVAINVDEKKLKLKGQYCNLDVTPPMPTWKPFHSVFIPSPELLNVSSSDSVVSFITDFIHNIHVTTIKIGLCTPSSCPVEDINKLVQIIPEKLGMNWNFKVERCEVKHGVEFTGSQVIILYVIGIMVFLVVVGTIVDRGWSSEEMERKSVKSTVFHVIKAFSIFANGKKISDFSGPQDNTGFVYGIVFLVFLWNVISNTFMYVNYDVASNFVEAIRLLKHLFYEIALNRVLPLQTLFYISGFLTTYRYLKSPEKQMNISKFLLKKYWRYTPAYAFLLAMMLLIPTWGSGPSWYSQMHSMYDNCKNNWWYNILYINNYADTGKGCLDHTWVFAVAAQLHLIAVFILWPLKSYPKVGLMINFVLAVASLASVALTNVYYDLPPNEVAAFLHPRDRIFYAEHSYYRVYTHLALYCTGVFVGYFMAKYPDFKIPKKISWILWVVTGAALLAALSIVHEWRFGVVPSPLIAAVYTTFSKIAEASFLAWLSIACMKGHAGGLEYILGWRPFSFFARLFFIAYIMHVPIIRMVMGFKKSHIFISELEIFYIVLSHAAGSYIVSYVLHLFLEAPWLALSDIVRRSCKAKTFNSDNNEPITEKPMKYSEKGKIEMASNSLSIIEKGHY